MIFSPVACHANREQHQPVNITLAAERPTNAYGFSFNLRCKYSPASCNGLSTKPAAFATTSGSALLFSSILPNPSRFSRYARYVLYSSGDSLLSNPATGTTPHFASSAA